MVPTPPGALYDMIVAFPRTIPSLALILLGVSLSYPIHQSLLKVRLSAYQPRAWKMSLEMGLATWAKDDMSLLRVELESLRGEVRNLRREKEGLKGYIRCLIPTKEDVEAQILEREAHLLEFQRRRDPEGVGLKGSYSPSEFAPRASDKDDSIDIQIRTPKRDNKDLETRNRELTDRYSESMRHLRNAQASSCPSCSLRNSAISLPPPFSDKSEPEHDEPAGWSEVTQSCYIPENLPPNPDRNRRQIAQSDSPEIGGDFGVMVGASCDVDLNDSVLCFVALINPTPSTRREEAQDPSDVTVPGDSGLGDFCLPDQYFDIDYPEPVLVDGSPEHAI